MTKTKTTSGLVAVVLLLAIIKNVLLFHFEKLVAFDHILRKAFEFLSAWNCCISVGTELFSKLLT